MKTPVIIADLGVIARRHRVRCRCACGAEFVAQARSIATGNTKSCGCLQRRAASLNNLSHGRARGTKHPLYLIWRGMKTRCYNPRCKAYPTYGGQGVRVDPGWVENPEAFIVWSLAKGWRPGLTVERNDPRGHYSPGNISFISKSENSKRKISYYRRIKCNDAVLAALAMGA